MFRFRNIVPMFALLSAIILLPGCAAALVGGLLYDNASDNRDRASWIENFGRQNLERERAGVPVLDYCSEIYKAKRSWALQPACAERVRRFEQGDTSALTI